MRALLLSSVALVIGAASAIAADVIVTTEVAKVCTVTADSAVNLPADGSPANVDFDFSCNFTGTTATLTFDSLNQGVGDSTHPYTITTAQGSGSSALDFTTAPVPTVALASVDSNAQLALITPILVAGTYTDTLSITIAPN